jgi:hypothetical protein
MGRNYATKLRALKSVGTAFNRNKDTLFVIAFDAETGKHSVVLKGDRGALAASLVAATMTHNNVFKIMVKATRELMNKAEGNDKESPKNDTAVVTEGASLAPQSDDPDDHELCSHRAPGCCCPECGESGCCESETCKMHDEKARKAKYAVKP